VYVFLPQPKINQNLKTIDFFEFFLSYSREHK